MLLVKAHTRSAHLGGLGVLCFTELPICSCWLKNTENEEESLLFWFAKCACTLGNMSHIPPHNHSFCPTFDLLGSSHTSSSKLSWVHGHACLCLSSKTDKHRCELASQLMLYFGYIEDVTDADTTE